MKKLLAPLFSILLYSSCQRPPQKPAEAEHTIAFYNIENLFDTEDDPKTNDADFLPEGDLKWTQERYQKKLTDIAKVIGGIGDEDGPEILGLCEIENRKVVQDLVNTAPLSNRNYAISHFDSKDRRGIDVALIYKTNIFKPLREKNYTVTFDDPELLTRDILLVTGLFNGRDTLSVLVNHWPSRRGGDESAKNRMTVALRAKEISDSLLNKSAYHYVLLMGDFNDEPTDKSITEGLQASNLLPSGNNSRHLYNAHFDLKHQGKGTYNYRGQWNMLDQIIISPAFFSSAGISYVPNSAAIYSPDWLQDTGKYAGNPLRMYAGKSYIGGYSDHFPVYIRVKTEVR